MSLLLLKFSKFLNSILPIRESSSGKSRFSLGTHDAHICYFSMLAIVTIHCKRSGAKMEPWEARSETLVSRILT